MSDIPLNGNTATEVADGLGELAKLNTQLSRTAQEISDSVDTAEDAQTKVDNIINGTQTISDNALSTDGQKAAGIAANTTVTELEAGSSIDSSKSLFLDGDESVLPQVSKDTFKRVRQTPFGPDFVKELAAKCHVRGMYTRVVSATNFYVGYSLQEEYRDKRWNVEYRFMNNSDGLMLLRGGYVGREDKEAIMCDTVTLTGTYNTSSAPISYTTEVGATFETTIHSSEVVFKSRVEDRGGLWKVTLSTGEVSYVSCYASTLEDEVEQVVFKGLEHKLRKVVFEFMGDDPLNEPSSGAGTARGYLYYNSSQSNRRPILLSSYGPMDESTRTDIISYNSVPDFAVSVRPDGSTDERVWVPNHGTTGVTTNVETSVMVDGKKRGGDPGNGLPFIQEFWFKQCESIIMTQSFDAEFPTDAGNPLWRQTVCHSLNDKNPELVIQHGISILRDCDVADAYLAMFPIETQYISGVTTNNGVEINDFLADGSNAYPGWDVTSAVAFGEFEAGRGHAAAISVSSLRQTGSQGSAIEPESFMRLWDRSDGIYKVYFTHTSGSVWQVGDKFTSTSTYSLISGVRSPDDTLMSLSGF